MTATLSNPATCHILNGDSLLERFPHSEVPGECIVARECLVVGDVQGENLEEFWKNRAFYIQSTYGETARTYDEWVRAEFEKILVLPAGTEVNLWFEEDLFCQVNLWFCLSLLHDRVHDLRLYLVKPPTPDGQPDWRGFGAMIRQDLIKAYHDRQILSPAQVLLLTRCWQAYRHDQREELRVLSGTQSEAFPFLREVCQAHLDRFAEPGRPQRVLREIREEMQTEDFSVIFSEFFRRQGIYGFGDAQVKSLLAAL